MRGQGPMAYASGSGFNFSTKSKYAIQIILDLALHGNGKPRKVQDIADKWEMSAKYISQLMTPLRNAGYVKPVRGPNGGYMLAKDPAGINALEIVDLMDGALHLCECNGDPNLCSRRDMCKVFKVWQRLDTQVRNCFASVTMPDLLACFAEDGDSREPGDGASGDGE